MSSFRDVDRAADAARCIDYLDGAAASMAEAKARLRAMAALDECTRWLDVGCGVGHDVADDPNGIGVDFSQKLLAEGRTRWPAARLIEGDAHALPFASRSFDGCRVERVLQHLVDPVAVVAEIRRVLRPGARVAMFEPDWESFTVAADDHDLTQRFAAQAADRTRHGRVGRSLAAMLTAAGFTDVRNEQETVSWRSVAGLRRLFGFDAVLDLVRAAHGSRAEDWLADLERREEAGTFWAFLTRHYAAGMTPGP